MNRKPFTPQPGTGYKNQGGGIFDCIGTPDPEHADAVLMRNRASGWTFYAHGIGIYDDNSIDWDYSTDGHFESVRGQQTTLDLDKILKTAVQTWGKETQTDMMIEEMAELTKEILNERRGREHNIAEEMADVQIMLAQMEIIFQNSKEVGRIFWEKVARLDQRLHDRREGGANKCGKLSVKMTEFLEEQVPAELCTIDRFGNADDFDGCGYCFDGAEANGKEMNCENCVVNKIFQEYAKMQKEQEGQGGAAHE